jgi:type IV pilus assembly protein PilV
MIEARRQRGVTMIEVLVAVVITVLGLLGMVALHMKAYATETESYQRAQAAILLEDMASRVRTNHENAIDYVFDDIGVGAVEVCDPAAALADRDLCEWGNLLRGEVEQQDATAIGAVIAGRACIRNPSADLYVITVVWQGSVPSAAPAADCGANQYSAENMRRALTTVVRIPNLGS